MTDFIKAAGHADTENTMNTYKKESANMTSNTIIKELTAKDSRWDVVMYSPDVTINNDPINVNIKCANIKIDNDGSVFIKNDDTSLDILESVKFTEDGDTIKAELSGFILEITPSIF